MSLLFSNLIRFYYYLNIWHRHSTSTTHYHITIRTETSSQSFNLGDAIYKDSQLCWDIYFTTAKHRLFNGRFSKL